MRFLNNRAKEIATPRYDLPEGFLTYADICGQPLPIQVTDRPSMIGPKILPRSEQTGESPKWVRRLQGVRGLSCDISYGPVTVHPSIFDGKSYEVPKIPEKGEKPVTTNRYYTVPISELEAARRNLMGGGNKNIEGWPSLSDYWSKIVSQTRRNVASDFRALHHSGGTFPGSLAEYFEVVDSEFLGNSELAKERFYERISRAFETHVSHRVHGVTEKVREHTLLESPLPVVYVTNKEGFAAIISDSYRGAFPDSNEGYNRFILPNSLNGTSHSHYELIVTAWPENSPELVRDILMSLKSGNRRGSQIFVTITAPKSTLKEVRPSRKLGIVRTSNNYIIEDRLVRESEGERGYVVDPIITITVAIK